eukprot:SAG31_NODE_1175_length_9536_cov_20.263113_4_plen_109_part_00
MGNKYICDTTADNSYTRSVKIKASAVPGEAGKIVLDYLFAIAPSSTTVNDGLNAPGRYFVYDPDVVENAEIYAEGNTPAGPSPVGSGAAGVSCVAAVAFIVGIVTLLA